MIIFVGDKPSSKNIDPKVPFVGTQSYKRLLEWIWEMNISVTDVVLCNTSNIDERGNIELPLFSTSIDAGDHVVALGKNAEKFLRDNRIPFYPMPHPSGLNRQNNDKKFIKQKLKECKEWLNA